MSSFILTPQKVQKAQGVINKYLINEGVVKVMLVDDGGNILIDCGESSQITDTTSLAALTAANFGATAQIAGLIGEKDFSLLFHKGENLSIHFAKIGRELIMVSIFGEDVSLGLIRCRVNGLAEPLRKLFEG
jgi:predicted regulator of Ras-like GTPase activity (Roadblock/LC7/MglB family)